MRRISLNSSGAAATPSSGAGRAAQHGRFDRAQWPTGGHCRDYFAVTADVAARITAIEMDAATDASDHQPLRLVFGDNR